MKADGHTGMDIAKYLGVSRATFYRYLGEVAAQPLTWPLESDGLRTVAPHVSY
jgi:hypothetical protein